MQIEVDFDAYKALTMLRSDESETYNDVIRKLLELPSAAGEATPSISAGAGWTSKGATLPHGTELRATYKGTEHIGQVDNGALVVDGERHASPSAAAMAITTNNVNGWDFWEARVPGSSRWKKLSAYR